MTDRKVLVVGIDAGSWNIINLFKDFLPNLNSLLEDGIKANLKSCIPPVTCPAWRCYSTGKDPSQLGVFWWLNVNVKEQKFIAKSGSQHFGKDSIWNILGEAGFKSCIINLPITYPAEPLNGIIISGPPVIDPNKAYYPKQVINKYGKFKSRPKSFFKINQCKALNEVYDILQNNFDIVKKCLTEEDWNFFHLTVFLTDDIEHHFWKHMKINNSPYKDVIKNVWIKMDQKIGQVLQIIPKNTITFIISDHGMTELKGTFYVNEWLREENYLKLKKVQALLKKNLPKFRLERIGKFLDRLKLLEIVKRIFFKKSIPNLPFGWGAEIDEGDIDWRRSKAIATSEGPIYLNTPSDAKKRLLIEEIIEKIKQITDPITSKPIIKYAYKFSEIYSGKPTEESPDIVLLSEDGYEISGTVGKEVIIDYSHSQWSATHILEGILIVNGDDIKKNITIKDVEIYDIAPTILYIFDCPIPEDIRGRVLKVIFEDSSHLAKKKVRFQKGKVSSFIKEEAFTYEDEQIIKKSLKKLGYIE
ncbi:MAG: alkaline phosphatase family protein [Candidatus Hodarchaeota archaeon]